MTIAYACDLNVYMCVNFGDEIFLMGEECITQINLNFFRKFVKQYIVAIVQVANLEFF